MSPAREEFLRNLIGISEAISLEPVAYGSTSTSVLPGIFVLRRGILVAGLIALESFVRDRTAEALRTLERWPRSFEDLPEKLRLAARLNALSHLQQFARMLKRQNENYEDELKIEIAKINSGQGTVLQFSKFVSGDRTGNLSDETLKELLACLQVKDCWPTFRSFASDVGIGVPSVQEVVKAIVRKRHQSAHTAGYTPTATDIAELRSNLLCVAMCFDVSVSSSMEQSLMSSAAWAGGLCIWRSSVNVFIAKPSDRGFRLLKVGRARAVHLVRDLQEAKNRVPRPPAGQISVLVIQDPTGRPISWDVI